MDHEVNDETDGCLRCGGPLVFLGRLGFRLWFRCRNCGGECSEVGNSDEGQQ